MDMKTALSQNLIKNHVSVDAVVFTATLIAQFAVLQVYLGTTDIYKFYLGTSDITCRKPNIIISDYDKLLHVLVQMNCVSSQLLHYQLDIFTIGLVPQVIKLENRLSSIF